MKPARILQKVDDFLQLFARLVDSGDIVEGHPALFCHQKLGARLAKAHRTAPGTVLHLAHDENPDADHQHERQHVEEQLRQQAAAFLGLGIETHILGAQPLHQLGVAGVVGAEIFVAAGFADKLGTADFHRTDAAFVNLGQEIRIGHRGAGRRRLRRTLHQVDDDNQPQKNDEPKPQILHPGGGRFLVVVGHDHGFLRRILRSR